MKNLNMIFSTGLIMAGFISVGIFNAQIQVPSQGIKVSVGSTISQKTVQPMKDLEQLIKRYAALHGEYPQSLQELTRDKNLQKMMVEIKNQNLEKVGFLDAHLLQQSQIQDRHLIAGLFSEGLVLYQRLSSEQHPSGYRITRSNRLGDLIARQDMPLTYSSWIEPGKYLNLSIDAHKDPIIVS